MMVHKIVSYAASIVTQNKTDRVRVLGRGARSKSKRSSPPARLSGSSTIMPATCLEKQSNTAKSSRTQGLSHTFGKIITDCCLVTGMFSSNRERFGVCKEGKELEFR